MSLASTAPLRLGDHGCSSESLGPEPERFILAWGENSCGQCLSLDSPCAGSGADGASGPDGAGAGAGAGATAVLEPRVVPCRKPMRSLAAGWERSLLIDHSGGLWGGGANNESCLWEESVEEKVALTRLDVAELDGVPFEAVQLGRDHALAVLEGGRAVVSWGPSNEFGQIGHGPVGRAKVRPGVVHLSGVVVKQVACGEFHSLVLTAQGEVFSFGSNSHGQLGTGRRGASVQAERVYSNHLRGVPTRGIAAGSRSSMALSVGGQVFCWGSNGRGRLGLGPSFDHEECVSTPVAVPNLPGMARAIAAGGRHSAVILRRGRLFLAGDNGSGQLGQACRDIDWTSTFYELPYQDYTLRVRAVVLGTAHTVILSYDGELYTCGRNTEGQLGFGASSTPSCASPSSSLCGDGHACIDEPVRLALGDDRYIVIGISSVHDHTIVLALKTPETHTKSRGWRGQEGRPQTAATRPTSERVERIDFSQTMRGSTARLFLKTIHESEANDLSGLPGSPSGGGALPQSPPGERRRPATASAAAGSGHPAGHRSSSSSTGSAAGGVPNSLSSGCTSRLSKGVRCVVVPLALKTGGGRHDSEGTPAEEVALLQPVVQAGVAGSVGFAGLSVGSLGSLVQAAISAGSVSSSDPAVEELRSALSAAFSTPSLLNSSFCFPGLYRPRLDAGGLLNAYKELSSATELFALIEAPMTTAAFEGLSSWANDHDDAAALVHRDQLRGVAALLLAPVLLNPQRTQAYELMSRIMRLVAWMPPEGRRELQELIVEDCSEEEVLCSLVRRVREHCDETVRRAHQMQRLSPEIWEGLMLLQLLWGANEAVANRLDQSLRTQPDWAEPQELGQSLSQTLSQFTARAGASSPHATTLLERFAIAVSNVRPPVASTEFHLQSLAEELVPPELEFRLFIENACAGPITPKAVLRLPLYAARTDYGFEYVLPSKMRSFMANRNLVPVSYTRKVLQVENHHAQVYLQHQVARRVAADLEVLPGHEIHIDPALLFFILKVRRDCILEDTTAALQRATPEDLRRQLKVVFEGEQGVDEGGLAREFFRLLSGRVFTAECGLFDPEVARAARVLWFDKGSACESTEFWLAGVILGLVVYNNMPGLDVRFPPVVFKKIKDEPLSLEDLRQVHPETYLSLRSLLQWAPEEGLSDAEAADLFENTFCLDFTISHEVQGVTKTRELCEGGKDRAVTMESRGEFVRLYCEWLLTTSVERQFEPFRKGVRRVCDSPLFNALDSAELEMIVCGEQDLDFTQLRRNAHYEGYSEDSPYIEAFWQVLLSLDSVGKKRFLSFVTGSDLAPVGGLQELQLVIQRNGGEPTERLPTAHTCFNLLLLPEYNDHGSGGKLERMLTTAMHNAEGFGLE